MVRELVGDLRGLGLALDCVLHRALDLGQIIQVFEYPLPPDFGSIQSWTAVDLDFSVLFVKEEKAPPSRRYF